MIAISFVSQAIQEGRSLFHLPAATRAMSEEFADPVSHGGSSLAFILAYARLVHGDRAQSDSRAFLVYQ